MKKILVALCAVALIGLSGCKKDEVKPNESAVENNGGGGQGGNPQNPGDPGNPQNPEPTWADIAGVYSPAAKIVAVSENGVASETWSWENGLLKVVANANGSEKIRFTHDGQGRVTTMSVNGNGMLSGTVNVSYTGEDMTLSLAGTSNVSAQLTNINNKPMRADLNLDGMDNGTLISLFNTAVAQFTGNNNADNIISGIDSVSGSMTFTWEGNNVSTSTSTISARLKTTIGQIAALLNNDFSMFGEYGDIIANYAQASPNTPLYINATLNDESDYSYDSNPNPLRRYMGDMIRFEDNMPSFNVTTFSANNIIEEGHIGIAHINIYTVISLPILGEFTYQLYNTDYNLYNKVVPYTYSYRADGYPESVESNNGTKTYTYQE